MSRPPAEHLHGHGRHVARAPHKRGVTTILGTATLAAAVALLLLQIFAPTQLERAVGEAQVTVAAAAADIVQQIVPESYPTITLGKLGGKRELNRCDGSFTEMQSYRITGVLPVYAAHNNCGGAIILGWRMGEKVKITGSELIYEVIDERHTKKWANIASLRGMKGELLVQTCFFGQNKMRFLALRPVTATPDPK